MNKTVIGIIVAIIVLAGVGTAVVLSTDSSNKNSSETSTQDTMEKMEKNDSDQMMEGEEAMMHDGQKFITLAEYEANKDVYADKNKVHFFHATWCVICQGIEKEINADPSRIPSDTVFIKTDFDQETALRQKYGVTYQYTFVQVDNDGTELKQWSATSLSDAIAGIES